MGPVKLAEGLVFEDDWYAVQQIDAGTFAIGEPLYYQQNWSYLLLGDQRSLLFDTGSFAGDITGVVSRRAKGPLTVLPSHMHFDHLGNVTKFEDVALADLPELRACAQDGMVTPTEALFLGSYENLDAPSIAVSQWLGMNSTIDLGGRQLQVVHTPGHSPDSISLHEAAAARFYAADFLYGGDLYGQVPGASLPDYLDVAERLADVLPPQTAFLSAHGDVPDGGEHSAPILPKASLDDLVRGLRTVRETCASWPGEPEWRFGLNDTMGILISPEAVSQWR
jgi:glyoxylase-like metal-dependent hydrolase (beta-lactamase superfamily II)